MTKSVYKVNKKFIVGATVVCLALAAGYGFFWSKAAGHMRVAIESFAAEQRTGGVAIDYDAVTTKGFPFLLRGAVSNVSVAGEDGWGWRAPALFVDAAPLSPDKLVFSAMETQHLDLGDFGVWRIDAANARASLKEDRGRIWIADLRSGPASMIREDKDGGAIEAERAFVTVAPNEADFETIETSILANGVSAAGKTRAVTASVFETVFALSKTEALSAGDAVEAWRAAGGEFVLERLAVEAEGGTLYAAGALHIDEGGFPAGVLQAEIVNPGVFALALGELGVVDQRDAEAVAGALSLVALAGGGKINAPMVLKDGWLTIARVKIAELPQIR